MAMDVKKTNAFVNNNTLRHIEMRALLEAATEIDTILAHDVVHQKNPGCAWHVVVQRRRQRIIHVLLLLSLLEVHNGVGDKAAMACAGSCSNTCSLKFVSVCIGGVDCAMVATL